MKNKKKNSTTPIDWTPRDRTWPVFMKDGGYYRSGGFMKLPVRVFDSNNRIYEK